MHKLELDYTTGIAWRLFIWSMRSNGQISIKVKGMGLFNLFLESTVFQTGRLWASHQLEATEGTHNLYLKAQHPPSTKRGKLCQ